MYLLDLFPSIYTLAHPSIHPSTHYLSIYLPIHSHMHPFTQPHYPISPSHVHVHVSISMFTNSPLFIPALLSIFFTLYYYSLFLCVCWREVSTALATVLWKTSTIGQCPYQEYSVMLCYVMLCYVASL